jgi:hypothetical protein
MKKNKFLAMFAIAIMAAFTFNTSVHAEDIKCAALGDVVIDASIADTVALVIKGIQIAVPVILVIFGMIDLMKGVMAQKEDEIKKGQQTLTKRVIAALLVYFVVAITKFAISAVSNDKNIINCANCFINGSSKCLAESEESEM